MDILRESKKIQEELIAWRRTLHQRAETGFALPQTTAFLSAELEKMGYTPQKCGRAGILAEIGKGDIFLLRADMDALPIRERSGEPFSCTDGAMHACGHDMHTAMLLGVAKLLKGRERELKGKIRLLFQPAEELLEGAKDVIENGALQGVQGALMLHVMTNVSLPVGSVVVSGGGVGAPAADFFTVNVKGKACHGSTPWNGVDAVSVLAYILLAFHQLSARELNPAMPVIVTIGSIQGGYSGNSIAGEGQMQGTLRAYEEEGRVKVKKRLKEITTKIAKAFHATARLEYQGGCPTLLNDEGLSATMMELATKLLGKERVYSSHSLQTEEKRRSGGSEDFAYISQQIPSLMVAIAAGERAKGYQHPLHHPKARFDEDALPIGTALFVQAALDWKK